MTLLTNGTLIKRQLDIDVSGDDTYIDELAERASDMIHRLCKRNFYTATETRTYTVGRDTHGRRLYFDTDFVSVGTLVNNGTTLTANEWRLLPPNATPKYGLELLRSSGKYWSYATDPEDAISVTGEVGYCTEANRPATVTSAATRLAAWLYQNRDNDGATIQVGDGTTTIPAEAPPFILRMLREGGLIRDRMRW